MRPQLSICCLISSDALARSFKHSLQNCLEGTLSGQYSLTQFSVETDFLNFIQREKQLDCLVLQDNPKLLTTLEHLREQATFLPTIVLDADSFSASLAATEPTNVDISYHTAVLRTSISQLHQIDQTIDRAIDQFLMLSLSCPLPEHQSTPGSVAALTTQTSLVAQQKRLSEKLKERLGYLGVYYKRNPQNFLRHMPASERKELLQQLREDYREIILSYFSRNSNLNEKIDNFVNVAFFADISVSTIVEIHMELMDEFSKQLQLEGRSDDILLDYRLTLIDAIAHLCEMYRRSIPRES
ncbi:MAG: circadian clock protein KaiA [Leptolyngbyaceae cyanobacterium SL_5_9]|nr:circadian clock protein KaiA [Leptolyngbyaceae cyanobacterium SL_5_9]NJO74919.1 circadian clock protein KaiA [Leptolyngbyaceae cyanobacterium RM1_406_9]